MAFSPDGKRIAAVNYRTPNDMELWLIDVTTGERRKVLPGDAATPGVPLGMQVAAYDGPVFAPDGRRLFLATNAGSEFRRLAVLDLATGALTPFGPALAWDVASMDLSADGSQLAVVHNVDGVDELRILDAATGQVTAKPALPAGRIGALQWHARQAAPLAFGLATARTPGQMMLLDTATGALDRWTVPIAQVDPSGFAFAQVVRWKSFDGRTISGLLTLPPADRFPGPRPVLVAIHGGPEGQAKAGFVGRLNYLINELGIALLEPNVRGSSGYGRTFVDLDNGVRREDSVRDIGSLLDWIATEPRLDAKRVAVQGGSYGGYMVLASLVHYSDRLRGGIDVVGISDFVSFLNNTESYRRDLRRVEYGDERDPAVRKVLDAISPLRNADRITAPLFVVHGRNDPRVPYTEAEQIVAKVRSHGVPVWYLLADNEGHGFARKANADFAFYAMVRFLDTVLLRAGPY
jgi:prolyl oligopeptidase PreP (S9A serine peptidase family)